MSLQYGILIVYNVFTPVIATKKIAMKKTKKINVSRICPKSVTGMKTFQMRMEMKEKTIENQRVPDLSKKRHRKENIPNADEKKSKND